MGVAWTAGRIPHLAGSNVPRPAAVTGHPGLDVGAGVGAGVGVGSGVTVMVTATVLGLTVIPVGA